MKRHPFQYFLLLLLTDKMGAWLLAECFHSRIELRSGRYSFPDSFLLHILYHCSDFEYGSVCCLLCLELGAKLLQQCTFSLSLLTWELPWKLDFCLAAFREFLSAEIWVNYRPNRRLVLCWSCCLGVGRLGIIILVVTEVKRIMEQFFFFGSNQVLDQIWIGKAGIGCVLMESESCGPCGKS